MRIILDIDGCLPVPGKQTHLKSVLTKEE